MKAKNYLDTEIPAFQDSERLALTLIAKQCEDEAGTLLDIENFLNHLYEFIAHCNTKQLYRSSIEFITYCEKRGLNAVCLQIILLEEDTEDPDEIELRECLYETVRMALFIELMQKGQRKIPRRAIIQKLISFDDMLNVTDTEEEAKTREAAHILDELEQQRLKALRQVNVTLFLNQKKQFKGIH